MLSRWLGCSKRNQLLQAPPRSVYAPRRSVASTSSPTPGGIPVWARRIAYLALAGGSIYGLDQQFNAAAIGRNVRTLYTGALIAADYKLNFKPGEDARILALHERVAERLFTLLLHNGGLYIKIGQAIAANSALLPPPFQTRFQKLFDEAPQVSYAEIERVFKSEFGRPPVGEGGVFEEFEQKAVASASIAQVHRAKLKRRHSTEDDAAGDGDGEWVAVKIQKPAVSTQVEYDLAAYRVLMWMYEKEFQLPMYFLVDFISSHLRLELDFLNEARNAEITAALVAAEPTLAGKVYIPKVYHEYTTSKVMTAEYIDGVKLTDRAAVHRLFHGASGHPPPPAGPDGAAQPLRGGARAVMETLVALSAAQIFQWGFVHCDPHPGNIIVRRRPGTRGAAQLVLLDHGLYVRVAPALRRSYARLWTALLRGDVRAVGDVARGWGVGRGGEELLASGVLLRPWKRRPRRASRTGGEENGDVDQYERSVRMKQALRQFLTDTESFPQALVFLGRNMRMVQGNNQALGSPVNRIKILGHWASRALAAAPNLTLLQRLAGYVQHARFLTVMFAFDVAFWLSKLRRWARGGTGASFEDELEQEMRRFSRESVGVELGRDAFDG